MAVKKYAEQFFGILLLSLLFICTYAEEVGGDTSAVPFKITRTASAPRGAVGLTITYPFDFTNRMTIFACTGLSARTWTSVCITNTDPLTNLITWTDADSTNYPVRFYQAWNADYDTDGDGLPDCLETLVYHTNPANWDTDDDYISDGDELLVYGTDPLVKDSDGDGMPDGYEIYNGLNPLVNDASGNIAEYRNYRVATAAIGIKSGYCQPALTNEFLAQPIVAQILDYCDVPLEGVAVVFKVGMGELSVTNDGMGLTNNLEVLTGSGGYVSVYYKQPMGADDSRVISMTINMSGLSGAVGGVYKFDPDDGSGSFDFGRTECFPGPQAGRGRVTSVTIPASGDKPVVVSMRKSSYAIDNGLKDETANKWIAGEDYYRAPKCYGRDEPLPGPFILTNDTTLALYNDGNLKNTYDGGTSPSSLHLDWKVVKAEIAMDGNRDGNIEFDNPEDQKYTFWVNDDFDVRYQNAADTGNPWEEDDLQLGMQGRTAPDCMDDIINCKRDLEDFTRLHLKVDDNVANLADVTYYLKIENVSSGSPMVNIFEAIDATTKYLTDSDVSDQQVQKTRLITVGTSEEQLPNQYIKTGGQVSPFILEGVMEGKGDLTFIIKKGNQEICRKSISLEMHPMSWFYDIYQTTVTSGSAWTSQVNPNYSQSQQAAYSPDHDNEYLLYVHGWNMTDEWEKKAWAETIFKRLWWQGYKGKVGLFSWPTLWGFEGTWRQILTDAPHFDNSEYRAWQSAESLSRVFTALNGSGNLRVIAHSMGNIVVGEALKKYSGTPQIKTYIASQAAMSSHYYDATVVAPVPQWAFPLSTPNIFGHFSSGDDQTTSYFCYNRFKVGGMFNYYNDIDYALTGRRWELNNVLRPDDLSPYMFTYTGSETHYSETGANRDLFSRGFLADPNLEVLSVTDDVQRYKIFSYCAESRVKALGTQVLGGGFDGKCTNLRGIGAGFDGAHYSHSLQFRSNIVDVKVYWQQVFQDCGFTR